jgi:hypothetical protein
LHDGKKKENIARKRQRLLQILNILANLVKSFGPYMPTLQHRTMLSQITVKQHSKQSNIILSPIVRPGRGRFLNPVKEK